MADGAQAQNDRRTLVITIAFLIGLGVGALWMRSREPAQRASILAATPYHQSAQGMAFAELAAKMYGAPAAGIEYQDIQQIDDENGDYGPKIQLSADPKGERHPIAVFNADKGRNVGFAKVPLEYGETMPQRYLDAGLWKNDPVCFYLHHVSAADPDKGWAAQTSNKLNGDGKCFEVLQDPPTWPIPVAAQVVMDPSTHLPRGEGMFPPVARLSEGRGGEVIFGFKCVAAWCHIGIKDTSSVRRPEFIGSTGDLDSERSRVHGYFDDQALAVVVKDMDGSERLDRSYRAQIVPEDKLGTYEDKDFVSASDTIGIKVARVYAPRAPGSQTPYGKTGLAQGWNDIYLRWNGKPKDYTAFLVDPAGGRHKFRSVTQEKLKGVPPGTKLPGTARWAWGTDEGIWIACDVGCCTLEFEF